MLLKQADKTGTGEKLIYRTEDDTFALEGNPRITDAEGRTVSGESGVVLYFDQSTGQASGKGRYHFKIPAKTLSDDLVTIP